MRVGFDAHMVGQRETGNETYVLGLLHGFGQIGFALDAYLLDGQLPGIHRNHRIAPHKSLIRIPFSTPFVALRDRLDLFHATYVLPPLLPCPAVVTVHDITFATHPEWFTPRVRAILQTLVPRAMRQAERVITVSECARRDIVELYGVPPEKIAVTYEAPRPGIARPVEIEAREPFFLYVGNVEPRKNVQTVIRAMRILHDRGVRVPLVVAGKLGLHYDDVARLVHELKLEPLVHFTGYVSDECLRELYATCTALVHPASYEGFGLTPLEAMAQGAAVIASDASSLPEVVGDAAILVPPSDPEGWAWAMASVLGDRSLRDDLVARGRRRSTQFSWERCARETLDVYRLALRREASNG